MITVEKEKAILSPLCHTNVNMFWGGIMAEVLARLGVQYTVIAPGSRSGPLVIGFVTNKKLRAIPVLDERSAAFFALGLAKQTYRPVVLIISSGTAAANVYPAIIEARMSKVPLIVLTADRPPEMRECHSKQTIDQVKIYGDYPLFYKEIGLPEANYDLFYYLRQTISHAFERSLYPQAGPVHLNIPFRNPLAPIQDYAFGDFLNEFDLEQFFSTVTQYSNREIDYEINRESSVYKEIASTAKGLILVGTVQYQNPEEFVELLSEFAMNLGWPVLAEGLSPVRNYEANFPALITRYDTILRNPDLAELLKPEHVIQIGNLPTSKVLRAWLKANKAKTWILEPSSENIDPTHGNVTFVRTNPSLFMKYFDGNSFSPKNTSYAELWNKLDEQSDTLIANSMQKCDWPFEGKVAWLLSTNLPESTPVFVATSTPVRDVEFFWQKNDRKIQMYFNRGANGIDGIVSTALGVAHDNKPSVLLVGDLTLLHDSNGLLIKNYFKGSLTIVLINNNGGRLFEFLPIAQLGDIFEDYFVTPQNVSFEKLAQYHGLDYYQPESWNDFCSLIVTLPQEGIRIIEMLTDGKNDVTFRKNLFKTISESLKI